MVNKHVYNKLISHIDSGEIIIPTFKKQQGNPILFSITMKDKIKSIEGDVGAKEIIKKNKDKILNLPINDFSILKNYNTLDSFNN